MVKVTIQDYDEALTQQRRALANSSISKENKTYIRKFVKSCSAQGMSKPRVCKYMGTMRIIAERYIKKDFKKATRQDIEEFVAEINESDYADWTKHDYKILTKRFWKWLKGKDEEYPPEVKWIKPGGGGLKNRYPKDLLVEGEIKTLIDTATDIQDKALIATMVESGCRISELRGMDIKDIVFEEVGEEKQTGARISYIGKTGEGLTPLLINCVPYLLEWLEQHPYKNNKKAPLWTSKANNARSDRRSYESITQMLKKTAEKAGIDKPVNPHQFRHISMSRKAQWMTEQQLCAAHNLAPGSRQARTYVHMSGRDLDSVILHKHGIKTNEEPEPMKPQRCPRCGLVNPATRKFCRKCATPLSMEVALGYDKTILGIAKLLDAMMRDNRTRPTVARFVRELGIEKELTR